MVMAVRSALLEIEAQMATVYLETTIPSYLASQPSRDLITAAHQQITHEWWETAGDRFDLFVSDAVLKEIRKGDPKVAERRLALVAQVEILAFRGYRFTDPHL
jgi:hypothetical protein